MCNHSGYSGRIAIHEVIPVNEEISELMARVAPISKVQHGAKKSGVHSMRYDGLKKVLRGLTRLAEIERVTLADDDSDR